MVQQPVVSRIKDLVCKKIENRNYLYKITNVKVSCDTQ